MLHSRNAAPMGAMGQMINGNDLMASSRFGLAREK
jgi:hypothetical protein